MNNQQNKQPSPALAALEMFVGNWIVAGENLEGAKNAPNTKVNGEVSYEWLPGGFFLICDWNRKFGHEGEHIGIGIISYNEANDSFRMMNHDNMGFTRTYALQQQDHIWTLTGDTERATIIFNNDDRTFTEYWEVAANDGWKPLCRLEGMIPQ